MNYEEVYDQLIQFAKSEHLLNEAKEAFYLWNLNPYSVLDRSEEHTSELQSHS